MVVGLAFLECVPTDATVESFGCDFGSAGDGSGLLSVEGICVAANPLTSCDILSVYRVADPNIGGGVRNWF